NFSFGTNTNSNGSYSIAEGLRFTLVDKTDLRTNKAFLETIDNTLGAAVNAEDKAIPAYIKLHNLKISAAQFRDSIENDSALYAKVLAFETQFIPDNIVNPEDLSKLRDKYRNQLW